MLPRCFAGDPLPSSQQRREVDGHPHFPSVLMRAQRFHRLLLALKHRRQHSSVFSAFHLPIALPSPLRTRDSAAWPTARNTIVPAQHKRSPTVAASEIWRVLLVFRSLA